MFHPAPKIFMKAYMNRFLTNFFFPNMLKKQSLLGLYGVLTKKTGLLEILSQHNFSIIGTSGLSTSTNVTSIERARYCLQVSHSLM